MAQEWIEDLAEDIRQRNREAATEYGRKQHYAGVVSVLGMEYFVALVSRLKENIDALRIRLQGDPASSETSLERVQANEVKITRARFPWVDARLRHDEDTLTLDYARRPGAEADPAANGAADRKTRVFAFRVASDDTLSVEDAFAVPPGRYPKPEDLARYITEVLFGA